MSLFTLTCRITAIEWPSCVGNCDVESKLIDGLRTERCEGWRLDMIPSVLENKQWRLLKLPVGR
jgi:hypothetical protein